MDTLFFKRDDFVKKNLFRSQSDDDFDLDEIEGLLDKVGWKKSVSSQMSQD